MNGFTIRITRGHGQDVESIEISADPSAAPGPAIDFPRAAASNGARAGARDLVDNEDGTVTDRATGLMWAQNDVLPDRCNFEKAGKACVELRLAGHADWRLPTRAELLTLVDDTRHEPAIDVASFPSCKSNWYWSSTPCAWSSDYAWIVHFDYGYADSVHRGYDNAFVRAVRSAAPGQ